MLAGCTPWPEAVVYRYRREGYWTTETLGALIDGIVSRAPDRTAVVHEAGSATYGALDDYADRIAAAFARLGLARGERIVVQLPNSLEFLGVTLAAFRLGLIPVFALPAHRRHEVTYLCNHTVAAAYVIPTVHQGFDFRTLASEVAPACPRLRHIVCSGGGGPFRALTELLGDRLTARPAIDPGEVAFFLLSGGTTGTPKLIPRTHQDYVYQLRASAAAVDVDERSVYLAALPAAHNAAFGCPGVLGTLRQGGRVVLAPSPSPGEVFPLIAREGVTITTLMPSVVQLWVEMAEFLPVDLSRVLFQVGGAHLDPDVVRAVCGKHGARFTHWFGMAEGFLSYTRLDDPRDVVMHTTGRPISPADEIRVVDESDVDVPPGHTGELLVRGPCALRGYYRADDYNATVFTPDGFLRTGDLVRIDAAGNMIVEGRIKDIINRGGEKVSAQEVEEQLGAHPAVAQVAVVAVADATLGERTCAFIVSSAPVSAAELRAFVRSRGLAEFKLPDHVEFVSELPYTSLGKINKRELRTAFEVRARGVPA
jgi:2,3-dihydroxybenzoate-AMP ligase